MNKLEDMEVLKLVSEERDVGNQCSAEPSRLHSCFDCIESFSIIWIGAIGGILSARVVTERFLRVDVDVLHSVPLHAVARTPITEAVFVNQVVARLIGQRSIDGDDRYTEVAASSSNAESLHHPLGVI